MKSMIKICIDARMINSSGIGTYLKNVIKNLDRKIFDICLLLNPCMEGKESFESFSIIYANFPVYSIKEQMLLPSKIPSCDIFWSPHFNVPILPIKAKKRVVTIHDLYHLHFYEKLEWKEKIYAKKVISHAIKKSYRIITVSNFSKSELIKYFPFSEEKIEVIYNGVNKQKFAKKHDQHKVWETLKKYSLFSRYFLFVGNFKAHKNLEGLIKAFSLFLEKTKSENCNLVIIGNKEGLRNSFDLFFHLQDKKIAKKIHVLSGISDEELGIIYSQAVALVFPSFYEGFGLPPLEAMSSNVPVIASNRSSIPEVCEDAAYYIDPEKPQEISEGMAFFINDEKEKEKYINLGKAQVEKFSWEKSAKAHEKIFIRLADENCCSP